MRNPKFAQSDNDHKKWIKRTHPTQEEFIWNTAINGRIPKWIYPYDQIINKKLYMLVICDRIGVKGQLSGDKSPKTINPN